MELWDIYDDNGNKTGKTIERNNKCCLGEGEHFLSVHIYLRNSKGDFLVQKRSIKKKNMPGMWYITGGCVIAGEDSIEGAIREVNEELGILIKQEEYKHITRLKRSQCYIDIWEVIKDIDISSCILQENEVDEVKYIKREEFFELLEKSPCCDDEYNDIIRRYYCN